MLGVLAALQIGVAAAQDMAPHAAAGAAFEALRRADASDMPRLSQPEAARALRTLGDTARFLPAAPKVELPALSDTCDRVRDAVVAYQIFGAMQDGQLALPRMRDNAARYQGELALLQPFLAHCVARQIPLAEVTLRQIDPRLRPQLRLGGLRRGQATVLQLHASLGAMEGDARIAPAHRRALLAALAETAPVHARALSLQDRAALRQTARARLAAGAPAQPWRRIEQAMSETRCEALCELASAGTR